MQPIASVNFQGNINNNRNSKISFQAAPMSFDSKLSFKAQGLIRRASRYVEDWTSIRKGELIMEEPRFMGVIKGNKAAELRQINNGKNSLLLEISDGKYFEDFIIDRKSHDFTYEKRVITSHGSATIKSFNSQRDNDSVLEDILSKKIELGLESILPKRSMRQLLLNS